MAINAAEYAKSNTNRLTADKLREWEMVGDIFTVAAVTEQHYEATEKNQMREEHKLALEFDEVADMSLILNKTQTQTMIDEYGSDNVDDPYSENTWIGKKVRLEIGKVNFNGKMYDTILVFPQAQKKAIPATSASLARPAPRKAPVIAEDEAA